MNIRIDEAIRLRVGQNEVDCLRRGESVSQRFHSERAFDFEIKLERAKFEGPSRLSETDHLISILLSEDDLVRLCANEQKKSGILVGSINIQADLFSKKNFK